MYIFICIYMYMYKNLYVYFSGGQASAGQLPAGVYRGTSLIRNSLPPQGFHRPLGIVLL